MKYKIGDYVKVIDSIYLDTADCIYRKDRKNYSN